MALIMLVDDEPDMRLALSTVLKKQGHAIVECGDGETALEDLNKQPVELVLLDVRLPGMDGVQTLKTIRQTRKDLPVVMVSGYGSVNTAVKVMELGASGYLSKPFGNKQLVETVDRVLEARRLGKDRLHKDLAHKLLSGGAVPAEPSEEARPGKAGASRRWTLAVAAAVMAVAGTWWGVRRFKGGVETYPVPFSNPTAIARDGGDILVADWVTQSVHRLRRVWDHLRPVRATLLPGAHITGLAVVGDSVYTCDSWSHEIQKRRKDDDLTLVVRRPSPGPSPSGLYWDGAYLWSCDSAEGRIYQHRTDAALTVVASYKAPGKTPIGLFKDEDYLWSADADTRQVYQHRLDENLTVLLSVELPELDEGREPLSAVEFDAGHWWAGRDGRNMLYRFNARKLVRTTSSSP